MAQISQQFDFQNKSGETLSGRLELPAGSPRAFAIFAHCFTCSKNIAAASRISKALSQMGFGVLRFDFTGLGNSQGDFANTNFSSNVEDLESAYEALSANFEAPKLLIGHSLGGAAVLKVTPKLEALKAIVTIGAPSDTEHVSHLFDQSIDEINQKGEAQVDLAGRKFKIKKQFIEDIKEQDVLTDLSGVSHKAFLIMHSPIDQTVSVDHAAKIYLSLKHPKSFIGLDQADHLISKPEDAEFIAQMICTWASKQIPETQTESNVEEGHVRVESRPGYRFTQDVSSQRHRIVADEPKSVRGDDLGMTPYELLLGALGTCTSMTMKMYAERKKINLKEAKVELVHSRKHVTDCENCDDQPQLLDHIEKKITLNGNLTPQEREKLHEISERCPINKTLQSEIRISSELKD